MTATMISFGIQTTRSFRTVVAIVAAASLGLILWEIFARGVAPLWIGSTLQPTGLIKNLFANTLGISVGDTLALAIHLATGLVIYPVAFYAVTRICSFGWIANGFLFGAATWFFAVGVVAPLAGLPFLLVLNPITWAALAGHILYSLGSEAGLAALLAENA